LPECSTVFRHGLFDARQRLTAPWCGTATGQICASFDTFLCAYTRKKIHSRLLFSFFSCFHIVLSLYSIKIQFDLSQYFRGPIHPYKK
jgi:hypothetical protein